MSNSTGDLKSLISSHADRIYGFFLGNKDGHIYKFRVFNSSFCPVDILSNLITALCSFTRDTNISDTATIFLSRSKLTFVFFMDLVFVLSHSVPDKSIVRRILSSLSRVFEHRAKRKFYSSDPSQVFAGASAVFDSTVNEFFSEVITRQSAIEASSIVSSTSASSSQEVLPQKESKIGSDQQNALESLANALFLSFKGIVHLVIVQHDGRKARLYFDYGNLEPHYIKESLNIIQCYLSDIISIMNDESVENVIDLGDLYQLVFTPMDGDHFLYIIAERGVDLLLLQPIFKRFAVRINREIHKLSG